MERSLVFWEVPWGSCALILMFFHLCPVGAGQSLYERGVWQWFSLELPSQPPRKMCLFPLPLWLPTKWPIWLVFMFYASEQLGMPLGHSPMTQDLLLWNTSSPASWEGLSQALQVPPKRHLLGEEGAVGWESGASFLSGKGIH